MKKAEVYGICYNPALIVYNLVSPKKHHALFLTDSYHQTLKEEVKSYLAENHLNKTLVVMACGLEIAQQFLKLFPDLPHKLVLFDYPGSLVPFLSPMIQWLDCDHQLGGAWQIAKIKYEEFNELLDRLPVLSDSSKSYLLQMKRLVPADKSNEIEAFSSNLPKNIKEILATQNDSTKSPIKLAKESRKGKETLKSLLLDSLNNIESCDQRKKLVQLVLDYQLALFSKKDFTNRLVLITRDEQIKKDFMNVRKWIDSKVGVSLHDSYYDVVINEGKRGVKTVLATHKKASEEDLEILLSYVRLDGKALSSQAEKVDLFAKLPPDPVLDAAALETVDLSAIFTY